LADLFKNKYRIPSARLQTWDYGAAGMYFITICCKNMISYFGNIPKTANFVNAKMNPTILGEIAESELLKSIEMRKDMNIDIAEYIIMPNHMHAIITIGQNQYNNAKIASTIAAAANNGGGIAAMANNGGGIAAANNRGGIAAANNGGGIAAASTDAMHRVSTDIPAKSPLPKNAFKPQSKNLASILRGYKSAVTTYARKNDLKFEWYIRFHDHIIRSEEEYYRIANYIRKNPETWAKDKFFRG
jgi:putative transposase